jgi:DNA repair protein RadC
MNLNQTIEETLALGQKTRRRYPAARWTLISLRESTVDSDTLDMPERVAAYWRTNIATDPSLPTGQETLVVIFVNTRRRVIGHVVAGIGTVDTIICSPTTVFRAAIVAAASAVILAHSHPSGDATPSEADVGVTTMLRRAGDLIKIPILDHLIMGNNGTYVSLRESGYCFSS